MTIFEKDIKKIRLARKKNISKEVIEQVYSIKN